MAVNFELFPDEMEFQDALTRPVTALEVLLRTSEPNAKAPADSRPLTSTATNLDQPDLFYLESVFVTAGYQIDEDRKLPVGWNRNDEFFEPVDVWMARTTPEDKPLNLNHNCADLVGHITEVFAEDLDGNVITAKDDIAPANFNLVTKGVLYKVWWTGKEHDEKKEQLVASIIEEIPDNKWMVSMECLFSKFDYALLNKDGSVEIVKRTKATAHMTKALRVVNPKADGFYNGRRIARVPRDMTFSGKGLVANPANPKSIIRAETSSATIIEDKTNEKRSAVYEKPTTSTNVEQKKMEIEALKAELATAKAALAEANTKNREAEEKRVADLTKELDTLKQAKASLETAVEATGKQAKEASDKLIAEKNELTNSLAQVQKELADMRLEKTKAERVGKVIDDLKLEKAKAETLVESLVALSSEQFDSHIQLLAQSLTVTSPAGAGSVGTNPQAGNTNFGGGVQKPTEPPLKTGLPVPEKKTNLPVHKGVITAAEGGKDADETATLDQAIISNEPALSVAAETNKQAETVCNIIAKAFGYKAPEAK